MQRLAILFWVLGFWQCSPSKMESSSNDTTSVTSSERIPELDLENYTVYDDETVQFSQFDDMEKNDSLETIKLSALTQVSRTPEGLQFKLKNNTTKLLKENRN